MAMLVYLAAITTILFTYSYLVFAPDAVAMPECQPLNDIQAQYLAAKGLQKQVFFSLMSTSFVFCWVAMAKYTKHGPKVIAKAMAVLCTLYLIGDFFQGGAIKAVDDGATVVVILMILYHAVQQIRSQSPIKQEV